MNRMATVVLVLISIFVCGRGSRAGSLEQATALELRGEFREAGRVLRQALAGAELSRADRQQLGFELDRLERICKDYPLTKAALFAALQNAVRELTAPEFEQWVAEGRFDSREFDGEQRFMGASVSNLFFRYRELEPRRLKPKPLVEYEPALRDAIRAVAAAAAAESKPFVLPKRFHVTMTATVESNAVPGGEVVRAWLPLPRSYPFQSDFKLRKTSSKPKVVAPESSPIRSLVLDQKVRPDRATEFRVEYDYTTYGVRFAIAPEQVRACDANDPALQPFLAEAPHVRFTAELRALSEQVAGGEPNLALKARKFYDWIAANIKYSYALEYSTIRNLSEYCRAHGYGDCGQEALLFMTLCRMNGIPARWQSGWFTFPGGKTIHDWCEIYLAPYGWMPVDPYMGIWATQYARTLTDPEKQEVRDFYFGGLDQWRMIANRDHCQELTPPKRALRSDPVDFQRGELEWGTNNIYFDQFSYELNVKELDPK